MRQLYKSGFQWLQEFSIYCFKKYQECSISIETLDNPGWAFFVKLSGIELDQKTFVDIESLLHNEDWFMCRVRDGQFEGACGPKNLSKVIDIFRKWAEDKFYLFAENAFEGPEALQVKNDGPNFSWLLDWYYSYCDGDWEHDWRIRIETCDPPGWQIRINCINTTLEGKVFEPVNIKEKDHWLTCCYQESVFTATCSPQNLLKAIAVLRTWSERV